MPQLSQSQVELLEQILGAVDPRLRDAVAARFERLRASGGAAPSSVQRVVLVGHRAAGKSRLLPLLAQWLQRPPVDLDAELERRHGRPLSEWVVADEPSFRLAERVTFASLPAGVLVAVGGGFLSHHGELLLGECPVLVPVTFETYRERLRGDRTRPRLRPELTADEEIERIFVDREARHARVPTVELAALLARTAGGVP